MVLHDSLGLQHKTILKRKLPENLKLSIATKIENNLFSKVFAPCSKNVGGCFLFLFWSCSLKLVALLADPILVRIAGNRGNKNTICSWGMPLVCATIMCNRSNVLQVPWITLVVLRFWLYCKVPAVSDMIMLADVLLIIDFFAFSWTLAIYKTKKIDVLRWANAACLHFLKRC